MPAGPVQIEVLRRSINGNLKTSLVVGSLGLASYLSELSLFIYWAKKFISGKTLRRINLFFGLLLIGNALYFLYTSFHSLLHIF